MVASSVCRKERDVDVAWIRGGWAKDGQKGGRGHSRLDLKSAIIAGILDLQAMLRYVISKQHHFWGTTGNDGWDT